MNVLLNKCYILVEVTAYIQSYSDANPVFSPPWTPSDPKIHLSIPEETPIDSVLLTVQATDPLQAGASLTYKELQGSDEGNYLTVHSQTGAITLNRRLDYENLPNKVITFPHKFNSAITMW